MKLDNLTLPVQNKVLQGYNTNKDFLHTYFDYANEPDSFRKDWMNYRREPLIVKGLQPQFDHL